MTMLTIDGSHGEGGGQILRTVLALAAVRGTPVRLVNIRSGRKRPGLLPQHLACVRALARISEAQLAGDAPGSNEVSFIPGSVRAGRYRFDIGTAGSTALLLQALIPPLALADGPSTLTLTGGTHAAFSPPFDFVAEAFLPALGMLGVHADAEIEKHGFYPAGGGSIRVQIRPSRAIRGVRLDVPAKPDHIHGVSAVCNLPIDIARRQRDSALRVLEARGLSAEIDTVTVSGVGRGTYMFLRAETAGLALGFSALGERGKRAETVGAEAAEELLAWEASGGSLEPHLADQLVPYLSLAGEPSVLSVSCITRHLQTNLWVAGQMLGVRFRIEGEEGRPGRVTIDPAGPVEAGSPVGTT